MKLFTTGLLAALLATSVAAGTLTQDFTVNNTDFATFGIGQMRDTGTGTLVVSGVSGTVTRAQLYWHGNTDTTDLTANANVTFGGTAVTGTNMGISSDTAWGLPNSHAYKADVTTLVTGNGNYALSDFAKPNANVNGAQLLVFFDDGVESNNRNVVVYSGNDGTQAFAGPPADPQGWDGTWITPSYTTGPAWLHLAVSDGQEFPDGDLIIGAWQQAMAFDGLTAQLGTGSDVGNGFLWDSQRVDISAALSPGVNTLSYSSPQFSDALSLVVAALDFATPQADLAITKTDGLTSVAAGSALSYTIVASNAGSVAVTGATVADTLPAALTGATWTCVGAGGGSCTASGAGNLNDTVNLPVGATVTYTLNATVDAAATGTLSNTATVSTPAGFTEATPANNSATDTDTIAPPLTLGIATSALAAGTTGQTYTQGLEAIGGTAPFVWSATGLPPGLSVVNGVIVGTPTQAGVFNVVITVTDGSSPMLTATTTLPLTVSTAALATVQPVPGLGAWALAVLASLAAGLGVRRVGKRAA